MRHGLVWFGSTIVAGTCLAMLAAQLYVDEKLRGLLQPLERAALTRSVSKTELSGLSLGRPEASHLEVATATIASGLLRRRCDGTWTWGVGARVELREAQASFQISSRKSAVLAAPFVCFDADATELLGEPEYSVIQGKPIRLSGFCGPEVSDLELHSGAQGKVVFEVAVTDRTQCLKNLSFLAPSYPANLIPERVFVRLESRDVCWSKAKLKGRSAVALVAEISRALKEAELLLEVSWETSQGEKVEICLRRSVEDMHSNFEVDLGLSEESLAALTRPFVSADNREVLADLRSNEARCDGSAAGLLFSSDLHQVKLAGAELPRRQETHLSAPGFRRSYCGDPESAKCRYQFGVIQMTEKGRLARPEQLEAIVRSLEGESSKAPLVLAFLHGWRHDASPNDGNRRGFEEIVRQVARRVDAEGRRRPVFGIYLSWPGRLFDSPSANKLATFWDRLETARGLGEPNGDLELILRRLSQVVPPREEGGAVEVVLLGHSMGADPLLHAVSRLSPGASPKSVVLVNPALSVARAEHIRSRGFPSTTAVVSYGSLADQVTQQFFPLGGAVEFSGSMREALFAETTTVNNSPAWIDGYLRPRPRSAGVELCSAEKEGGCVEGSRFRPAPGKLTVVGVDESIVEGHADFMKKSFVEHLVDLILQ